MSYEPRPVGDQEPRPIDIAGYAVPFHANGQPVLVSMTRDGDLFVIVFETLEQLVRTCTWKRIAFESVKKVMDGRDFLASIPGDIRIAVNARPHDDPAKRARGEIRFTEIFR